MKKTALKYIRYGLSTIPANKNEKRPSINSWKKYQRRLPTADEWNTWQADGLCIICGAVSGNLLMIDFDQQGKAFEDFKREVPPELLNRCAIERSQSGGIHIIIRGKSPIGKSQRLAVDADKKVLIETRGEGGLFLCDPTPGYKLLQGSFASIPVLEEFEIETLLDCARFLNQSPPKEPPPTTQTTHSAGADAPHLNEKQAEKPSTSSCDFGNNNSKKPGDDYNDRGDIRALLQKHGWKYISRDDQNEQWQRPGKTRGSSASLCLQKPLFNVFSTNADPFDQRCYSFFDVYAILEHNGDHSAAAKCLADTGFGENVPPVELPDFITRPPGDSSTKADSTSKILTSDPGPFPKHLLNVPGYIGELAKFIDDTSFVSQPVFALASSIAFQGFLCSHVIKDPLGTRPNVNILSIGRTTSGKERGRKVIKEILTTLGNQPPKYNAKKVLFEDTASYQAIIRTLDAYDGRIMWLWDEVGKVLPSLRNDRASHLGGILTLIMRLYSSSDSSFIPHIRAKKEDNLPTIEQPHLILYGTSVPRNVFEGLSVESLTDGLMGRLLFFEGDDKADDRDDLTEIPPVPQEILDGTDWWLTEQNKHINPKLPVPKVVPVTVEALAVFTRLANLKKKAKEKGDDVILALYGRAVEQARQLALIYAASENPENPVVDENAARWASELIVYVTRRKYYLSTKFVADEDFDRRQKEVLRYIESCDGKCTRNMLTQKFRHWEGKIRNAIMDNLFETNSVTIEYEQKSKKGGPRTGYVKVVQF